MDAFKALTIKNKLLNNIDFYNDKIIEYFSLTQPSSSDPSKVVVDGHSPKTLTSMDIYIQKKIKLEENIDFLKEEVMVLEKLINKELDYFKKLNQKEALIIYYYLQGLSAEKIAMMKDIQSSRMGVWRILKKYDVDSLVKNYKIPFKAIQAIKELDDWYLEDYLADYCKK